VIAGMDDLTANRYDLHGDFFEHQMLSRIPEDRFVLLLKHRPLLNETSQGLFDLQLSGHTHKGQIFPFSLLTRLFYHIHPGLTRLREGSFAYVSRGSGTWGPPVRFLSPPEVTLIEIVKAR